MCCVPLDRHPNLRGKINTFSVSKIWAFPTLTQFLCRSIKLLNTFQVCVWILTLWWLFARLPVLASTCPWHIATATRESLPHSNQGMGKFDICMLITSSTKEYCLKNYILNLKNAFWTCRGYLEIAKVRYGFSRNQNQNLKNLVWESSLTYNLPEFPQRKLIYI